MNKNTKQKWYELSSLVLDLNSPSFHVFLEYSGHINTFYLSIHKGGWRKDDKGKSFERGEFERNDMNSDVLQEAINWLCREYESEKEEH